jgi:hypothetical protein
MRRELNDAEKNIVRKSIRRIRKELEHFDYLMEYNTLMINKGLYMNYLDKLEEFKQKRSEIMSELETYHHNLNILQEQLDKGVEVKQPEVPSGIG